MCIQVYYSTKNVYKNIRVCTNLCTYSYVLVQKCILWYIMENVCCETIFLNKLKSDVELTKSKGFLITVHTLSLIHFAILSTKDVIRVVGIHWLTSISSSLTLPLVSTRPFKTSVGDELNIILGGNLG